MAAVALLKFTQGALVGADGEALEVLLGIATDIENADDTDVATWRITLLYAPPGSALVPGVLATGIGVPTLSSITPDVAGACFRIQLEVWDALGTLDTDIRCIGIRDAGGMMIPPYQRNPDAISLLLKPDELNFSGQGHGWSGPAGGGLLWDQLAFLNSLVIAPIFLGAITVSMTVGTALTAGLTLTNPTAAILHNQQFSPAVKLSGQGWDLGLGASVTKEWALQAIMLQDNPVVTHLRASVDSNPLFDLTENGAFSWDKDVGDISFTQDTQTAAAAGSDMYISAQSASGGGNGGDLLLSSGGGAAAGLIDLRSNTTSILTLAAATAALGTQNIDYLLTLGRDNTSTAVRTFTVRGADTPLFGENLAFRPGAGAGGTNGWAHLCNAAGTPGVTMAGIYIAASGTTSVGGGSGATWGTEYSATGIEHYLGITQCTPAAVTALAGVSWIFGRDDAAVVAALSTAVVRGAHHLAAGAGGVNVEFQPGAGGAGGTNGYLSLKNSGGAHCIYITPAGTTVYHYATTLFEQPVRFSRSGSAFQALAGDNLTFGVDNTVADIATSTGLVRGANHTYGAGAGSWGVNVGVQAGTGDVAARHGWTHICNAGGTPGTTQTGFYVDGAGTNLLVGVANVWRWEFTNGTSYHYQVLNHRTAGGYTALAGDSLVFGLDRVGGGAVAASTAIVRGAHHTAFAASKGVSLLFYPGQGNTAYTDDGDFAIRDAQGNDQLVFDASARTCSLLCQTNLLLQGGTIATLDCNDGGGAHVSCSDSFIELSNTAKASIEIGTGYAADNSASVSSIAGPASFAVASGGVLVLTGGLGTATVGALVLGAGEHNNTILLGANDAVNTSPYTVTFRGADNSAAGGDGVSVALRAGAGGAGGTNGSFSIQNTSGNATLDITANGAVIQRGFYNNGRTVDGDVTLQAHDCVLRCSNATAGGVITITLLSAATVPGMVFEVKDRDGSCTVADKIVLDCDGAETIDGAGTKELVSAWESIRVRSNGTNWEIM